MEFSNKPTHEPFSEKTLDLSNGSAYEHFN